LNALVAAHGDVNCKQFLKQGQKSKQLVWSGTDHKFATERCALYSNQIGFDCTEIVKCNTSAQMAFRCL